jgi:hypothetical protein
VARIQTEEGDTTTHLRLADGVVDAEISSQFCWASICSRIFNFQFTFTPFYTLALDEELPGKTPKMLETRDHADHNSISPVVATLLLTIQQTALL